MKKVFFLFSFATLVTSAGFAQKKKTPETTSGYQIEIGWQKLTRSEFDTYLGAVSDTLDLAKRLSASPNEFNIGVSGIVSGKHIGFEAGANYGSTFEQQHNSADKANAGRTNLTTFGIRLGPNFILNKNFYVGAQIMLTSTEIKSSYASTNSSTSLRFESTGDGSPFRAMNLMTRFQAAICFPSKKTKKAFKIVPYYDLSITKHNFYKASDKVLKDYSGSRNSTVSGYGLRLAYYIGKRD